ncbi:MAG: elongation factor P-like protein YeiP [Candidatus Thiodiazotropha sp.]
MPKACELKKGAVIEINGVPHAVKQVEAKSPSSRGAATLYKIRYTNLKTGQKLDESYKGDDFLREADCLRTPVQYLYKDGEHYVFMNMSDYTQYSLDEGELAEELPFLTDGLEGITGLIVDGALMTIELPVTLIMQIVDTAPGIKGATATGRTKPARLSTGLEIQVPEYLESGETIKINTTTCSFVSRA